MNDDRLPPLDPATYTPQQRAEAQAIINGPRGALIAPFVPLLRSPELCGHAQRMGEYLRYRSALPLRLSELAILVTARFWTQPVEWAIHAPIAQREGVSASVIEAIAQRKPPPFTQDDEALVFTFCNELHATKQISDETWTRAIATFGEQGTIDLIGLCGYYALLSMVMNAARTPAPQTEAIALPP